MTVSEPTRPPLSRSHPGDEGGQPDVESPAERLAREHEELFHELRSIIPGAEVLFAFLLTIAFTSRFTELTGTQRWTYFITFLCSGLALVVLLAPSAFHRMRFRQGDKEVMLHAANLEALAALLLISFAIAGTVFLITDVMFDHWAAIVTAGGVWLVAFLLWWGYPLSRTGGSSRPGGHISET